MEKGLKKESAGVVVAGGFFRAVLYVLIGFLIIYAGKSAYTFGYSIFNQQPMQSKNGKEVTVVIKDDASVYKIGKVLENKGLIEDAKVFVIQEKLSNYKDKLQSGTYILNTSMTADEMMAVLAREETEGQPVQTDKSAPKEGSDDAIYDKVSEEVEAGDTEESAEGGANSASGNGQE